MRHVYERGTSAVPRFEAPEVAPKGSAIKVMVWGTNCIDQGVRRRFGTLTVSPFDRVWVLRVFGQLLVPQIAVRRWYHAHTHVWTPQKNTKLYVLKPCYSLLEQNFQRCFVEKIQIVALEKKVQAGSCPQYRKYQSHIVGCTRNAKFRSEISSFDSGWLPTN